MKIFEEKLKENNIKPWEISLDFHTHFWYANFDKGEPICTIVDILLKPQDGKKEKIGEFAFTLIRKHNFDQTINNLFDTADMVNGDLTNAVNPFVDENLQLVRDFLKPDVIYIDKMYLNKKYRKKGIGAYSFAMLYDVLSRKASLITVYPKPYDYDNDKKHEEEIFKKEKANMIKLLEWFDFKQSELNPTIYWTNTDYKLSLLNN